MPPVSQGVRYKGLNDTKGKTIQRVNPLQTNDAYMRHELEFIWGFNIGVNTLYWLFCLFKLFLWSVKG